MKNRLLITENDLRYNVVVKTIENDFDNHDYGLFANKSYDVGERIILIRGELISAPTRTSIQIDEHNHIESFEAGKMNHDCDPNTEIKIELINEFGMRATRVSLVAIRDIGRYEELTFDYETTESELSNPFQCSCHGNWIRGRIYRYQE
jgi:SET domain-containing protein